MATFDFIVWGATGYTGNLVVEYLAKRPSTNYKWAIAGRTKSKLEKIKANAVALNPKLSDLEIVVADVSNQSSIEAMVNKAKLVIATAGPYVRVGEPVVKACAKLGTSYVDVTGETYWVKEMIQKYEADAKRTGATLVSCCGFDSVPAEMTTFFMAQKMKELTGEETKSVRSYVRVRGGASGGTLGTMFAGFEAGKISEGGKPSLLNTPTYPGKQNKRDDFSVDYQKEMGQYYGPFIMANTNTRIVRRTQALLADKNGTGYGQNFTYFEHQLFPSYWAAKSTQIGLAIFAVVMFIPPLRWILKRLIPAPGTGAEESQRKKNYFIYNAIAESPSGKRVKGLMSGPDPYEETAKYAAETSIAILANRPDTGFLTPATAGGQTLLKALEQAGNKFEAKLL
eukprot:Clim_evm7s155 gene=Clim_evmTU7s155